VRSEGYEHGRASRENALKARSRSLPDEASCLRLKASSDRFQITAASTRGLKTVCVKTYRHVRLTAEWPSSGQSTASVNGNDSKENRRFDL
jgi:hypothetical protein